MNRLKLKMSQMESCVTRQLRKCRVEGICTLIFSLFISSCQEFVAIESPRTEIVSGVVFSDDATATSAIRGIYSQMIFQGFASGDVTSMTYLPALSADEIINFSADQERMQFAANSLQISNRRVSPSFWADPYKLINNANTLIEGLNNSSGVTTATKKQLIGEALFIRAFCHFYLVNLFGDVPIIKSTDFAVNRLAHRSSESEVYKQVISDLEEAKVLLSEDYSFSKQERIQPNRWAAVALLARVYIYTENWNAAEEEATSIIGNNKSFSLLPNLNDVFLANSKEAIWQLKPVQPGNNTNEARIFTIFNTPPANASLSNQLIDSFELNDNRFDFWVKSVTDGINIWYYPFKYKVFESGKPITEYSMVLRLSEQYLIRAEARARLNNIAGAKADLDAIRSRAALSGTVANDQTSLLNAIAHERQVELFTEWGHRWLDLKRTGRADEVLGSIKPDWQPTDVLYPIPESELNSGPNLIQNPGY